MNRRVKSKVGWQFKSKVGWPLFKRDALAVPNQIQLSSAARQI